MTIHLLNKKGFLFYRYDQSFVDHNNLDITAKKISNVINEIMSVKNESLFWDIDTIVAGQELRPHYHIVPGSFQVVAWLPTSPFCGRDFLFGNNNVLYKVKPKVGYMCFMKTNDPFFIHGVTELLSEGSIKSLGFTSQVKKVEGNQDIYVDERLPVKDIASIDSLVY
jgi:hypothetical protein